MLTKRIYEVAKQTKGRKGRNLSASVEEAVKLLKPYRGRDGIYAMFSKNDKGDYTEVGVYNYNTKRYALYRSDMVDSESVTEFKEVISGQ